MHAMAPKRYKAASKAKASTSSRTIDIAAAAAAKTSTSKRSISADWGGSTITAEQLKAHRLAGLLPSNVKARAPGDEVVPSPAKDEVVIFSEHLFRGFTPPGNLFFRQVLGFYKLYIHDLVPNSILTLSNFVTLCEDYLQIDPDLDLWLALFCCNPQPETSGGPDRKSTRLNSSHSGESRMPSSA